MSHSRLEREVDWRQQVFTSLVQSFERARIDEVRNTPVITVIEAPTRPVRPDGRGVVKWGIAALALGIVIAVLYAFTADFANKVGVHEGHEYHEFTRLRHEMLCDLRRPLALIGLNRVRAFPADQVNAVRPTPDAHACASDV
jgi:hypothetical protein